MLLKSQIKLSTTWIAVGLLVASLPKAYSQNCNEVDDKTSELAHPATKISQWQSLTDLGVQVEPTTILPESYLNEVRSKLGDVSLKFTNIKSQGKREAGFECRLVVNKKNLVKFNLFPRKDQASTIEIDNVRLENHLVQPGKTELNAEQRVPGLPPDVYRYAHQGVDPCFGKGTL